MLAKIAPSTNDFHALARYLVNGKGQGTTNPNRVAWTLGHNLPDDDPELAAKIMSATADDSPRTKKAAYHVMIAWHAREKPTPEVMQDIARQTLELSGLGEHQALVMGHGDRPHKHLHMMINRVHPDTGRAWKTSHDFAKFDRVMQQLSDAHGFAYVPAHTFNPELTDELPKKPNSRATYAAKRGANTNRTQWSKHVSRQFGERLAEELDASSTWEDLMALLEESDLAIEEKGQGLVVCNGDSYTKLSSLRLNKTAKGFGKRYVPPVRRTRREAEPQARSIFAVDGVDMTRALVSAGLAERQAVRDAVNDAITAREERFGTSLMNRLLRDAMTQTVLSPMVRKHKLKAAVAPAPRRKPARRHC